MLHRFTNYIRAFQQNIKRYCSECLCLVGYHTMTISALAGYRAASMRLQWATILLLLILTSRSIPIDHERWQLMNSKSNTVMSSKSACILYQNGIQHGPLCKCATVYINRLPHRVYTSLFADVLSALALQVLKSSTAHWLPHLSNRCE